MRILIISDSHRKGYIVDRIIRSQPDARHIFFLGDLVGDIEDFTYEYTDRVFHIVSGNCDFVSEYPCSDIARVKNINIFYTHGHTLGVKGGTGRLCEYAKQRNCQIALYGHTHIPHISYSDGLYVVNPGSCAMSRQGQNSYAVIDITDNGIMPIIINV